MTKETGLKVPSSLSILQKSQFAQYWKRNWNPSEISVLQRLQFAQNYKAIVQRNVCNLNWKGLGKYYLVLSISMKGAPRHSILGEMGSTKPKIDNTSLELAHILL